MVGICCCCCCCVFGIVILKVLVLGICLVKFMFLVYIFVVGNIIGLLNVIFVVVFGLLSMGMGMSLLFMFMFVGSRFGFVLLLVVFMESWLVFRVFIGWRGYMVVFMVLLLNIIMF